MFSSHFSAQDRPASWLPLALLVIVGAMAVGCSQGTPEVAFVSGIVTIDDQPFTEGKVMFAPVAEVGEIKAGRAAFGLLDAQGRFTLSTFGEQDGALVGKHRVTLYNGGEGPRYQFKRVTYPEGFVAVLPGQVNEINISFTSDQIQKYGNRL